MSRSEPTAGTKKRVIRSEKRVKFNFDDKLMFVSMMTSIFHHVSLDHCVALRRVALPSVALMQTHGSLLSGSLAYHAVSKIICGKSVSSLSLTQNWMLNSCRGCVK